MLDRITAIAVSRGTTKLVLPPGGGFARKYTGPPWSMSWDAVAVSFGFWSSAMPKPHRHQLSAHSSMVRPYGCEVGGNSAGVRLACTADCVGSVSCESTHPAADRVATSEVAMCFMWVVMAPQLRRSA